MPLLILSGSLFILFLFYKIIKLSIKTTNYPLISIFFLMKFFTFAYIGTVIHMVFQGYYTNPHFQIQFFLSSITLLLFPLGMLFATYLLKFDGKFNYTFTQDYKVSSHLFYVFLGLFISSLIVFVLFVMQLEMIPIVAVAKGLGVPYAYELRSAAGNTFPGKYYRYAMFMKDLPFYLMIVLFFLRNTSKKWSLLFYSVVIFNMFVAVMDIQKAPLMQIFLILLLASLFYYKKINWKLTIGVGLGLGISVLLMYSFFSRVWLSCL